MPDPHGVLRSEIVAVDEGNEPVDKRFGPLPMREMAGAGDQFEPGVRDLEAPFRAVGGRDDPVLGAPQQQSRAVDAER